MAKRNDLSSLAVTVKGRDNLNFGEGDWRSKRFNPKGRRAITEAPKAESSPPAIPAGLPPIRWKALAKHRHQAFYRDKLLETVKATMLGDLHPLHRSLYKKLVEVLEVVRVPEAIGFYVCEIGVKNVRKKKEKDEFGVLIRITVPRLRRQFTLPHEFLEKCASTFLSL